MTHRGSETLIDPNAPRVVLVTGAGKRVGAEIARHLHTNGFDIALHYRESFSPAQKLADELNAIRQKSCEIFAADLARHQSSAILIDAVIKRFGQLDALVNNASSFYRTPIGSANEQHWDDLFASNAKAPFFLAQAAAPFLKQTHGALVNITDIYADRPLPQHTIYCMAKAALVMLTKSLAIELGPEVRVNAIAPGAILWPEDGKPYTEQEKLISKTALKRTGTPAEIASAVLFLLRDASFVTGEILRMDGGRALQI